LRRALRALFQVSFFKKTFIANQTEKNRKIGGAFFGIGKKNLAEWVKI
jgi:hypothetical protein